MTWDISELNYTNVTHDFSSSSGFPTGGGFVIDEDNGQKALSFAGGLNEPISRMNFGTAWDLSTLSFSGDSIEPTGDDQITGGFIRPNGEEIYYYNTWESEVVIAELSTAWDITTFSITNTVSESDPFYIWWRPDGSHAYKLYTSGNSGVIEEFSASTNWDYTSLSSTGQTFDTGLGTPNALFFKPDGGKFWTNNFEPSAPVKEFELSTAWDVTTATEVNSTNLQTNSAQAMPWRTDNGLKFYEFEDSTGYEYEIVPITFDGRSSIDGGSEVWAGSHDVNSDERGFVYDTSSYSNPGDVSPSTSNYSNSINESGSFSSGSTYSLNESGLTEGTEYFLRAYVDDGSRFYYSEEFSLSQGELIFIDTANSEFNTGSFTNTIADSDNVRLQKETTQFDQESFESSFGDWINGGSIETSTDTWTRNTGGTPSSNTGPGSAQDGSYYVYVETSAGEGANSAGDETIMELPLNETTSGQVSFYYHMYGDDIGTLYLEGYDGSSWNTIWSKSGSQGDQWVFVNIGYDSYSDLRFRNVAAGSFNGDTSLDLITVSKGEGYLTSGTFTAESDSVSRLVDVQSSTISWTETLNGQSLSIETRYSTDGGSNWSSWTSVTNGGSANVSGIGTNTSNALVQYRANLSGDGSDTPELNNLTFTVKAYGGVTDSPGHIRQTKSGAIIETKTGTVQKTN